MNAGLFLSKVFHTTISVTVVVSLYFSEALEEVLYRVSFGLKLRDVRCYTRTYTFAYIEPFDLGPFSAAIRYDRETETQGSVYAILVGTSLGVYYGHRGPLALSAERPVSERSTGFECRAPSL